MPVGRDPSFPPGFQSQNLSFRIEPDLSLQGYGIMRNLIILKGRTLQLPHGINFLKSFSLNSPSVTLIVFPDGECRLPSNVPVTMSSVISVIKTF